MGENDIGYIVIHALFFCLVWKVDGIKMAAKVTGTCIAIVWVLWAVLWSISTVLLIVA